MNRYDKKLLSLLPRRVEYGSKWHGGLPVVEAVAFLDSIYWLCQRCGKVHSHNRTVSPEEFLQTIEQCDKGDSAGDLILFYKYEIDIHSVLTKKWTVK